MHKSKIYWNTIFFYSSISNYMFKSLNDLQIGQKFIYKNNLYPILKSAIYFYIKINYKKRPFETD